MQNSTESKFSSLISIRNSKGYSLFKTRSDFFLIFFVGLIFGILIFLVTIKSGLEIEKDAVKAHIHSLFSLGEDYSSRLAGVFSVSKKDICSVFFIFLSGFTYFCFAFSGVIVFTKGISLGLSVTYIFSSTEAFESINSTAFGWIFLLMKFALGLVIVFFAADAYIFSYDFREIWQKHSILRRASVTYKFVFYFIRALGASLLFNFIYCSFIKLLQTT